jgi:hypothetical protein
VGKLKHPDRIDRMHTGFLNFAEKIAGKGRLFHCRWCRLQFYDRRPLAPDSEVRPSETTTTEPGEPTAAGSAT